MLVFRSNYGGFLLFDNASDFRGYISENSSYVVLGVPENEHGHPLEPDQGMQLFSSNSFYLAFYSHMKQQYNKLHIYEMQNKNRCR